MGSFCPRSGDVARGREKEVVRDELVEDVHLDRHFLQVASTIAVRRLLLLVLDLREEVLESFLVAQDRVRMVSGEHHPPESFEHVGRPFVQPLVRAQRSGKRNNGFHDFIYNFFFIEFYEKNYYYPPTNQRAE